MKVLIAAAAAMSIIGVAAPAAAEGVYGSIGYSSFQTAGARLDSVTGRIGYDSSTPFGAEVEASTGLQNDNVGGVNVKLRSEFAGYLTGKIKRENFAVFARVGVGSLSLEAGGVHDEETSMNYGVGGEWFVDKNGLRVEYTRHNFDAGEYPDLDVYTFSYVRKF